MNPRNAHPLDFFPAWFAEPFDIRDRSVAGVMDALNRHPMAGDETAQDHIIATRDARYHPGRFHIYGENQYAFHCFVHDGDETKTDPPVFFETCLDLHNDCAVALSDIIDGDHVMVASRFSDFLWQMLGHHICLRARSGGHFSSAVTGIVFDAPIKLDDSFINPLGREFPAGNTCFVADDAICIPDWGAAFLTSESRRKFVAKYFPSISGEWR